MVKILDFYKDYQELVVKHTPSSVVERVELWDRYIKNYPELEDKLKSDYENEGINWRVFAHEKVFNHQESDFKIMAEAYENIKRIAGKIIHKAEEIYGNILDINLVYYSGLNNSAGWVDHYDGKMAILIGIDKIAELRWQDINRLETLIAHEIAHVIHFQFRNIDILDVHFTGNLYKEGLWRLYEEGIATYFQDQMTEHHEDSRGYDWHKACLPLMPKLKNAYLEALQDTIIGTRDFYGDWYKVYNISDVGYFLGRQLIEHLHQTMDFKTIACLDPNQIEHAVMSFLNS